LPAGALGVISKGDMARYELRLYLRNGCGAALLGEVATIDAPGEEAAIAEARGRVRQLPRHCAGALFDAAGVQLWADEAPSQKAG
jgi:hypothetical protein